MRDDELETLLAAYRRHTRFSSKTEARILARVQRSVSELPEEDDAPNVEPSADVPVRWIALGLAVAAALVLVWIRPGLGIEREQQGTPDEAVDLAASSGVREVEPPRGAVVERAADDAPPPEPAPHDGSRLEAEESEQPHALERPDTRSRSRDRATAPAAAPASPDELALAPEAALLRRANAALSAGDPDRALTLLQDWERQFAPGHLHEEHAALRAVALCGLGRSIQGRGEAKAFGNRYPGSALAQRVRNACAEEGEKRSTGTTSPGQ
jgi:hypothetical protein